MLLVYFALLTLVYFVLLTLVFDAAKIQIFFYFNNIFIAKSNKNTPLSDAEIQQVQLCLLVYFVLRLLVFAVEMDTSLGYFTTNFTVSQLPLFGKMIYFSISIAVSHEAMPVGLLISSEKQMCAVKVIVQRTVAQKVT